MKKIFILLMSSLLFFSCKKNDESPDTDEPKLVLKLKLDDTQQRLDNFGQPDTIPSGHSAQTPVFHSLGIHYIEISTANSIPAYSGTELYNSPSTTDGGSGAIDFDEAIYAKDGETFFSIPLKNIPPGTYPYLRASLSYQNFDLDFKVAGILYTGRLASFIGAKTYIRQVQIKDSVLTINSNKDQGFWAFEMSLPGVNVSSGQSASGATTVPNPLAGTSAIPAGSCLVTGIFPTAMTITGNETSDIVVECSVSINQSLEWSDFDGDGFYEPTEGDTVVDMGVRGLIPTVQ